MRRKLRSAALLAALLALALWALPAAASSGVEDIDGWRELGEYVRCAFAVASAAAMGGVWGILGAAAGCIFDALFD